MVMECSERSTPQVGQFATKSGDWVLQKEQVCTMTSNGMACLASIIGNTRITKIFIRYRRISIFYYIQKRIVFPFR